MADFQLVYLYMFAVVSLLVVDVAFELKWMKNVLSDALSSALDST